MREVIADCLGLSADHERCGKFDDVRTSNGRASLLGDRHCLQCFQHLGLGAANFTLGLFGVSLDRMCQSGVVQVRRFHTAGFPQCSLARFQPCGRRLAAIKSACLSVNRFAIFLDHDLGGEAGCAVLSLSCYDGSQVARLHTGTT